MGPIKRRLIAESIIKNPPFKVHHWGFVIIFRQTHIHETLEDRDTLGFVVWSWWRKADDDHKMPAANPFLSGRKQEEPVLVGGSEHFFSHILGRIIPTDFHIFQRGWNHQPAVINCSAIRGISMVVDEKPRVFHSFCGYPQSCQNIICTTSNTHPPDLKYHPLYRSPNQRCLCFLNLVVRRKGWLEIPVLQIYHRHTSRPDATALVSVGRKRGRLLPLGGRAGTVSVPLMDDRRPIVGPETERRQVSPTDLQEERSQRGKRSFNFGMIIWDDLGIIWDNILVNIYWSCNFGMIIWDVGWRSEEDIRADFGPFLVVQCCT